MNEATAKQMTPDVKRWIETWRGSFQEVLSQIAGQAMAVEISEASLPAGADDLWYAITCGGVANGEMSLRTPVASGSVLAQTLLGEANPQSIAMTPEHKEALEELLRQVTGHAATALASPSGEVKLSLAPASSPTWSPACTIVFQKAGDEAAKITVEIQMSVALANRLSPVSDPQDQIQVPPPINALPANYERLMDVELDVKLRFGTRRMELRDVLGLSPGFVVELDRSLQAPVDLLLDGRVIAQGDVVVVDGKYGLRISEVLDPEPVA